MEGRASLVVGAPPARVLEALTEFAAWPEIWPQVRACEVRGREESAWELGLVVEIIRRLRFVIRLQQHPVGEDGAIRLSWALLEGDLLANEGEWTLAPADEGRACALSWRGAAQVGAYVPQVIQNTLTGVELREALERLKTRVERAEAPTESAPPPAETAPDGG